MVGAKSTLSAIRSLDCSGLDGARIAHQKRNANRLFVHEPLVIPAVVAQKEAMIRSVNDDRVVWSAGFRPGSPADRPTFSSIEATAAKVVAHETLIVPRLLFLGRQPGRNRIGNVILQVHKRHLLRRHAGRSRSILVAVVESGRLRYRFRRQRGALSLGLGWKGSWGALCAQTRKNGRSVSRFDSQPSALSV